LRKRVRDYIENCLTCLVANTSPHRFEGQLHNDKTPTKLFQVLHIDHFGPLQTTSDGHKHVLVAVDAFTRFTNLFAVKTTSAKEVCKKLHALFQILGRPHEIVADRGSAFTSQEFADFLNKQGIKLRKVAVASPWANGIAERTNRFLKSSLAKIVQSPDDWLNHLDEVQYVLNNTYNSAIKSTPAKLLLGYDQRSHIDKHVKDRLEVLANNNLACSKVQDHASDLAIVTSDKLREYNKRYYDSKHKKPSVYQKGDFVLVRDLQRKLGINSKLKANYRIWSTKF